MSLKRVLDAVYLCRLAGITPFIWGERGVGKSEGIDQLASLMKWGVVDFRGSQMEASDLRGLPDRELNSDGVPVGTNFLTPSELPKKDRCSVSCSLFRQNGTKHSFCLDREGAGQLGCQGILKLDEINRSQDDVLQAIFQLVYDKAIGSWTLPEGWSIVAIGNYSTSSYVVNQFKDEAFMSRFCHLDLIVDDSYYREWAQWMTTKHEELGNKAAQFIGGDLTKLLGMTSVGSVDRRGYDPKPSPRSLEMAVRAEEVFKKANLPLEALRDTLMGIMGVAAALEWMNFNPLVSPRDIVDSFGKEVKERMSQLTKPQLAGLTWGIASLARQLGNDKADKPKMINTLSFAEHLALEGHRDLAVGLGANLMDSEISIGRALMVNSVLTKALLDIGLKPKTAVSWMELLVENPELHKILSLTGWGKRTEKTKEEKPKKKEEVEEVA